MNLFVSPSALAFLIPLAILVAKLVADARESAARLRPWPGIARNVPTRSWRLIAATAALALGMIAVAGPRLGPPQTIEATKPRDLVVVVDLSRSMLAEQPSRIEKAARALRSLADSLEKSGEARVAMVVFASRPELAFPLTSDMGHLRHVADRLADMPPPSVESETPFVSGTRMGEALRLATTTLAGRGEIVLLSDGDDPIDDDEWKSGITAARTSGIVVHTVAVGEPGVDATIPSGDDVLRYDNQIVKSRVHPERLEEIARKTGGLTMTADKGTLPLGPMLHERWRSEPTNSDTDTITTPIRSAVRGPFLLAAFFAWLASWVRLPLAWPRRLERIAAALVVVSLVGAEPIAETWLQRGDAAFARRDFDEAIRCWRHALPEADDPGRVAFDLAAAYFRKQDYAAAATAYRQALDDGELPAERGQRAWFDLGNALLEEAGTTDRRLLEQAMTAYRHCLAGSPDAELRGDTEHNLELAGRRWLKTQPPPKGDEPGNERGKGDTKPEPSGTSSDPNNPQKTESPGDPNLSKTGNPKNGEKSSKASKGAITVLPDSAERAALTPDDAIAHLERAIGRIDRDRPPARPHDVPLRGKDW